MTARKPLVRVGGRTKELPAGDTLLGVGSGGAAMVSIGEVPPASPSSGDLWWNSASGRLNVYYYDGSASQWVDASPAGSGVPLFIGPVAPIGISGAYQWIQTGLGVGGNDHTIWIEDGL
jgi:hypothetical protein